MLRLPLATTRLCLSGVAATGNWQHNGPKATDRPTDRQLVMNTNIHTI